MLLISLALFNQPLYAADFTIANGVTAAVQQTLDDDETGTVQSGGELSTSGEAAILAPGDEVTIENAGVISASDSGVRAISMTGDEGVINNEGTISVSGSSSIAINLDSSSSSEYTILNSGLIEASGSSSRAIVNGSGDSVLILNEGYEIDGTVDFGGGTDTLELGGSGSESFSASRIGSSAQYRNFEVFEKTGNGTWTISGSTTATTPWTLKNGTLTIASSGALGAAAGRLTIEGGTVRFDGDASIAPRIELEDDGLFNTGAHTVIIDGAISGEGNLIKSGNGTLALAGASSYEGETEVETGTLLIHGTHDGDTIIVSGDATLGGTGTIRGDVIFEDGATLLPGLTIRGDVDEEGDLEPISNTVSTTRTNVNFSSSVRITSAGKIDGGTINGAVDNDGLITGTIKLGPKAYIVGGEISGSITGSAAVPARIRADILAGTRLENVVILAGSKVDPTIVAGANLRFENASLVPPNLDLKSQLPELSWDGGDGRDLPDLDGTVSHPVTGASSNTVLEELVALGEDRPTEIAIEQSSEGEIVFETDGFAGVLIPTTVRRRGTGDTEGVRINENGDVLLTSESHIVTARSVMQDNDALEDALDSQVLTFTYDASANIIINTFDLTNPYYLIARAGLFVTTAPAGSREGLAEFDRSGLANVKGRTLVFRDGSRLLKQDLVPVSANWTKLRERIIAIAPGTASASMGADGVITVLVGGQQLRLLADYRVVLGATGNGEVVILPVADLNADGTGDFQVTYPDGGKQNFYRYP